MDGVILFADDHIYSEDRPESDLFKELRNEIPVLGVSSLEQARTAVNSIGSFRAVILDWQYGTNEEQESVIDEVKKETGARKLIRIPAIKEDEALSFLNDNDFYSLVYIFSEIDIEELHGTALKEKYGQRIKIKSKDKFTKETVSDFKEEILSDIESWQEENENLSVPINWSSSINSSIQKIFTELSEADKNWIRDIYNSASDDGANPETFVIEILQLILSESLVQDGSLIEAIQKIGSTEQEVIEGDELEQYKRSLSRMFSRLIYSKVEESSPIMTGDIFQVDESEFGVLITPECDIKFITNDRESEFEFLVFNEKGFGEYLNTDKSYNRTNDNFFELKEKRKESLRKIFNQELSRLHFLPLNPLISKDLSNSGVIDFRLSHRRVKCSEVLKLERSYKLNSPFVQQLRQRYLSYVGRIGTPSLPKYVRDWNLS